MPVISFTPYLSYPTYRIVRYCNSNTVLFKVAALDTSDVTRNVSVF